MAGKKKKNVATERAFVAISPESHAVIKEYTEKEGYGIGKFVEKAALEKIEIQKLEKEKK